MEATYRWQPTLLGDSRCRAYLVLPLSNPSRQVDIPRIAVEGTLFGKSFSCDQTCHNVGRN